MIKKIKSLSVFFPTYNDSKSLSDLIKKAEETAKKITSSFEIIIINDGSTDNTLEILNTLKKKYTSLRIINHRKNLGYGAALISGFKNAKKEWVFYTDGDGQYDPKDLLLLIKKVNDGIDVVNGYKLDRKDNIARKIIGNLYNFLMHRLYKLPISDVDCDFRLIRKSMVDKINLESSSGLICLELILKLKDKGAQFSETFVHHYKRRFGNSKFFAPKNIIKTFIDNLRFYLEYRKK